MRAAVVEVDDVSDAVDEDEVVEPQLPPPKRKTLNPQLF